MGTHTDASGYDAKGPIPRKTRKPGRPKGSYKPRLKCQHCGRKRFRKEFYTTPGSSTGHASVCKKCNSEDCLQRNYRRILKKRGTGAIQDMIRDKLNQIHYLRTVLAEVGAAVPLGEIE